MRFYLIIGLFLVYTSFKATQLWPSHRVLAIILTLPLFALILSGMFVLRSNPSVFDELWFRALAWTGCIAMGFLGTFIILSLPFDVANIFVTLLQKLSILSLSPEQREFLSRGLTLGLFCLSIGLSAIGLFQALHGPRVKAVNIPVAGLKEGLKGLKIAQISDLHVSATIRSAYVMDVVAKTNATNPDIIVITGDLLDGQTENVAPHLQHLRNLKATYGVYYVTGNHEYYWQPASLLEKLKSFGFHILINENRILSVGDAKLLLAGIPDIQGARVLPGHAPNILKAAETSQSSDFKIMLAHRPDNYAEVERAGFDLLFAGHTHAGQFFPFSLFIGFAHKYYQGLAKSERMWVYVNPGTGYWGPANRFATPTEITLATLL